MDRPNVHPPDPFEEIEMSAAVQPASVAPVPAGMHTLTPHIVCADADAAIDFYVKAFGAVELARMPGPDGKLMYGLVGIGDSTMMLGEEMPAYRSLSPKSLQGTPVVLHLYVPDVDASIARAVTAGCHVVLPASDMFWGDRYGQVEDPFGHRWSLATHIRDVTPEEMQAAMTAMGRDG